MAAYLTFAVAILILAPPAYPQARMRVKQVNLAEMVDLSKDVIRGRVLSVKAEKHPDLQNTETVVITLQVEETLKGTASGQFSFRQVIWNIFDRGTTVGYKVGEDVVLMLLAPSEYGLSSPAGFEQGRFRVQQDAQGNLTVLNGRSNRGLLANLEASVPELSQRVSSSARVVLQNHREGPISYAQFKDIISGVIAARQ